MIEYAVGPGFGQQKKVRKTRLNDLPGGKRMILQSEKRINLDLFKIDKMPGGNTPENVKVLAGRLRKLEAKLSGISPGKEMEEFR